MKYTKLGNSDLNVSRICMGCMGFGDSGRGQHGVTMTEVSLAWLLTKVTSPVVGATKLHHIEGAAKAVELELTSDEITYLEEAYVPHPLAGVMAQNKPAAAKEKHVWSTGDQKIGK